MNGCIYRTKDNECELWTDNKHKSFCDPDCKDKHPSNADRIRNMTDEELAEFIARQRFCAVNPIADKLGIDVTTAFIVGRKNVLDWLRQEAET